MGWSLSSILGFGLGPVELLNIPDAARLFGVPRALQEADALDISFVDARQLRLGKKCSVQSDDWHHMEDLFDCPDCHFREDHYHSLYAMRLKASPQTGGLHLPYPLGHFHGLPNLTKLAPADHHVSDAGGRRLHEDVVALFHVAKIAREIEHLIGLLAQS